LNSAQTSAHQQIGQPTSTILLCRVTAEQGWQIQSRTMVLNCDAALRVAQTRMHQGDASCLQRRRVFQVHCDEPSGRQVFTDRPVRHQGDAKALSGRHLPCVALECELLGQSGFRAGDLSLAARMLALCCRSIRWCCTSSSKRVGWPYRCR
jgi:hypothetical protein